MDTRTARPLCISGQTTYRGSGALQLARQSAFPAHVAAVNAAKARTTPD